MATLFPESELANLTPAEKQVRMVSCECSSARLQRLACGRRGAALLSDCEHFRPQVYNLNRRIQAQQRAPAGFPGFIREGFNVKVIADGYKSTPSG